MDYDRHEPDERSMTAERSSWLRAAGALVVSAGSILFVFFAAVTLLGDWDDLVRGWSNPARYEFVRRENLSVHDLKLGRSDSGDFNGDGVDDRLDVVYLRREFLTQGPTSGMVHVWSGADGALLLAHPVPAPICDVFWCGDSDGDSADEVFVDVAPSERFAFKRGSVR